MNKDFVFHPHTFQTIVGGVSSIDLPRLAIQNLDEARQFISTYGFDLNDDRDLEKVWSFHLRAITFIREQLLNPEEVIPEEVADSAKLGNISNLLVYASRRQSEYAHLQRWSCAILRIMHVYAHIENDLFIEFADQIQELVLKPFRSAIVDDPITGPVMGGTDQVDQIALKRFDVKPFKASTSSVIKLLTKPQAVAFSLMDKMGVRFVTRSVFDAFRVIRFLADEHIISLPNIMPDQSRNTLYPSNLFAEVAATMAPGATPQEWEEVLQKKFEAALHRASFLEKPNEFSADGYKVIKFISRQLLKINIGEKPVRFFFPFEIQIVDYQTYFTNLAGAVAHVEYKKRQRMAARDRVLGQMKMSHS